MAAGCRSLIMSMLNVDALARASIDDIKYALSRTWGAWLGVPRD
jgi:hypothetical protein